MNSFRWVPGGLLSLLFAIACGAADVGSTGKGGIAGTTSGGGQATSGGTGGMTGSGGASISSGTGGLIIGVGDSGPPPPPSGRDGGSIVGPLPADFVRTEAGGYKLGPPVTGQGTTDTGISNDSGCSMIVGVVRDFKGIDETGGHPDFERFSGSAATRSLVAADLGADQKPVYTSVCEANPPMLQCPGGQQTTTRANFDQWYRSTDGVNRGYLVYFMFQAQPNSTVVTFNSQTFFPVDGAGWNSLSNGHNFGFTTEIHTKFAYKGGETFTFQGDDDLWVFINGKLAIDLGGLHGSLNAAVNLDASAAMLGITKGNVYSLELFHAERHTTQSRFRLDTSLTLVDCGTIPPDIN